MLYHTVMTLKIPSFPFRLFPAILDVKGHNGSLQPSIEIFQRHIFVCKRVSIVV